MNRSLKDGQEFIQKRNTESQFKLMAGALDIVVSISLQSFL